MHADLQIGQLQCRQARTLNAVLGVQLHNDLVVAVLEADALSVAMAQW